MASFVALSARDRIAGGAGVADKARLCYFACPLLPFAEALFLPVFRRMRLEWQCWKRGAQRFFAPFPVPKRSIDRWHRGVTFQRGLLAKPDNSWFTGR